MTTETKIMCLKERFQLILEKVSQIKIVSCIKEEKEEVFWLRLMKLMENLGELCEVYGKMNNPLDKEARQMFSLKRFEKLATSGSDSASGDHCGSLSRSNSNCSSGTRLSNCTTDAAFGLAFEQLRLLAQRNVETPGNLKSWTNMLSLLRLMSNSYINEKTFELMSKQHTESYLDFIIILATGKPSSDTQRLNTETNECINACQLFALQILEQTLTIFTNILREPRMLLFNNANSIDANNDAYNNNGSTIKDSLPARESTYEKAAWLVRNQSLSISRLCFRMCDNLLYGGSGQHEAKLMLAVLRLLSYIIQLDGHNYTQMERMRIMNKCLFPLRRIFINYKLEMRGQKLQKENLDPQQKQLENSTRASDPLRPLPVFLHSQETMRQYNITIEKFESGWSWLVNELICPDINSGSGGRLNSDMIIEVGKFCGHVLESDKSVPNARASSLALIKQLYTCLLQNKQSPNGRESVSALRNQIIEEKLFSIKQLDKWVLAALRDDSSVVRLVACAAVRVRGHFGLPTNLSNSILSIASLDEELELRIEALLCLGNSLERKKGNSVMGPLQRAIESTLLELFKRLQLEKLNQNAQNMTTTSPGGASKISTSAQQTNRSSHVKNGMSSSNEATTNTNREVSFSDRLYLIYLEIISSIEIIFNLFPRESLTIISRHLGEICLLYRRILSDSSSCVYEHPDKLMNGETCVKILRLVRKILIIEADVQQSPKVIPKWRRIFKLKGSSSLMDFLPASSSPSNENQAQSELVHHLNNAHVGGHPSHIYKLYPPIILSLMNLSLDEILTKGESKTPLFMKMKSEGITDGFSGWFGWFGWFGSKETVPMITIDDSECSNGSFECDHKILLECVKLLKLLTNKTIVNQLSINTVMLYIERIIHFYRSHASMHTLVDRLFLNELSHCIYNILTNASMKYIWLKKPTKGLDLLLKICKTVIIDEVIFSHNSRGCATKLLEIAVINFAPTGDFKNNIYSYVKVARDTLLLEKFADCDPLESEVQEAANNCRPKFSGIKNTNNKGSPKHNNYNSSDLSLNGSAQNLQLIETRSNRFRSQLVQLLLACLIMDSQVTLEAMGKLDGEETELGGCSPPDTSTLDLIFKFLIHGCLTEDLFCPQHEIRIAIYSLSTIIKLPHTIRPTCANEESGKILIYLISQIESLHSRYNEHLTATGERGLANDDSLSREPDNYLDWSARYEQCFLSRLDQSNGLARELQFLRRTLDSINETDKNWYLSLTEGLHLTQLKLLTQDLYNYAEKSRQPNRWKSIFTQ